uniref:Proteasome assembly chaperone 2 n=1 Tax=Trichuris muris TaxID=70415 RepID=A0A5S6QD19_TRIMR
MGCIVAGCSVTGSMSASSTGQRVLLPREVARDSLLILPTVSIGNASQQAVDLLICNMNIPFFCHLNADDCFLPIFASDPFDPSSTQVITACSAYYCPVRKLLVLQFRTDFLVHRRHVFLKRLVEWVRQMNFRSIILLTSSWAAIRREPYLNSPGVFYLRSDSALKTEEDLNKLSLIKVPEDPELALPGSGFTVEFYEAIRQTNISLIVLVKYCYEGASNVVDAVEIFENLVALQFDRSKIKELKKPFTWD